MRKLWNGSYIKLCCSFLICLLMCFYAVQLPTNALYTTFKSNKLSETEAKNIINNISFEKSTKEPKKKPLERFDVNKNGMFAIGFSEHEDKTVLIYDQNGVFQYGYKFETSGSFYLKYDEGSENLIIFSVRGGNMLTVNETGIVRIDSYVSTVDNSNYFNSEIDVVKRKLENCEYVAKNKVSLFSESYSQLVRIEEDGSCKVLYKTDTMDVIYEIILFIIEMLFLLLIGILVIKKAREHKEEHKTKNLR